MAVHAKRLELPRQYPEPSGTWQLTDLTAITVYQYDAGDNLIRMGATSQAFNNANQLCWTASTSGSCNTPPAGATRYQYDTRGNRTSVTPAVGAAQTLGFDQANRLTRYVTNSTTTYSYNTDGLRMSKTAGSTTQFVWDTAGGLPLLLKDGSTLYIYGPGGMPLQQINGSTISYLHHDQLGSTRLLTDAAGAVQATYQYDPYGNLIAGTGSVTNPFRFAGEYQDVESGFYYLRARYYDSNTGQFISIDPVVTSTRQAYAYAQGSPLDLSDPSGLLSGNPLNWNWGAARNVVKTQVPQIRPTENYDPNYNAFSPDLGYLATQNARELSNPDDWGSANAYRVATDDAKFGLYLGAMYCGGRALALGAEITGFSRIAAANPVVGRVGPIFGGKGILNNNDFIRLGWSGHSWMKDGARVGKEVFRLAVGTKKWKGPWPIKVLG